MNTMLLRLVMVAVVVAFPLGVASWAAGENEGKGEPETLPALSLTNFDGAQVELDSIGGGAAIVVFTYAKCIYGCPMITFYLKDLDEELGNPEGLRFVHISVNPAVDSASEIRAHFKKFEIDPSEDPRWLFLNGPEDAIASLLQESDIEVRRTPMKDDVLIEHTIRVQVVDKNSRVVASFPTYLWDDERMKDALRATLGSE